MYPFSFRPSLSSHGARILASRGLSLQGKVEWISEVSRALSVVAVILLVALVLGATGTLDDVANVIVLVLRAVFELLVYLINLFVRFINLLVDMLRNVG